MAYWLYCQACKQWSKSTTPLSDDKSCSFCSEPFVTGKPLINSIADQGSQEKTTELDNQKTTLTEIPEAPPKAKITDTKELSISETTERQETSQEQQISLAIEESEIEETPEMSGNPELLDTSETDETNETLATEEKPETAEEHETPEMLYGPETQETEETEETPENSETPEDTEQPKAQKMTRTHETYMRQKRRIKNLR